MKHFLRLTGLVTDNPRVAHVAAGIFALCASLITMSIAT
jgi:hypothetical protein